MKRRRDKRRIDDRLIDNRVLLSTEIQIHCLAKGSEFVFFGLISRMFDVEVGLDWVRRETDRCRL